MNDNKQMPMQATKVDAEADKHTEHEHKVAERKAAAEQKARDDEAARVEAFKVAEAKAKRLFDDNTLQVRLNKVERAIDA